MFRAKTVASNPAELILTHTISKYHSGGGVQPVLLRTRALRMARAHGLTRAPRVRACKDRTSAHRITRSKVGGDHIDASLEMNWPKAGIIDDSCRPRCKNQCRLHPRQVVELILVMTATVGAQLNSAPTLIGSLIDSTVMDQVRRCTPPGSGRSSRRLAHCTRPGVDGWGVWGGGARPRCCRLVGSAQAHRGLSTTSSERICVCRHGPP